MPLPAPARRAALLAAVLAPAAWVAAACGRDTPAATAAPTAGAASTARTPASPPTPTSPAAGAVDSALPRAEAMRRFTAGLGPAPVALTGGERSREALVRRFVRDLERRDTADLRRMDLSRAEFAYLYYPTNVMARPPYDLGPGLMWFQLDGNGGKGLAHLIDERGGRPLGYAGVRCDPPAREGENRVHPRCRVRRVQAPGDTVDEVLFGGIVERGGRFKFISYANKL